MDISQPRSSEREGRELKLNNRRHANREIPLIPGLLMMVMGVTKNQETFCFNFREKIEINLMYS